METAPTGESEDRLGDRCSRRFDAPLRLGQIIRIQDDQRTAGSYGFARGKAAGQPAIAELGVRRPVVGELPVEYGALERLAARDVGDVELNVVDLPVPACCCHAVFQMLDGWPP